jgi:hypothetical protein
MLKKLMRYEWLIFVVILGVFVCNGLYVSYPDEYVNLLAAKAINAGHLPYKDFFDHHLPFARNKVLEKCSSEILAFTDDDCLPPKNWLKNILKSHLKHPQATAIQGKTLPLNERSLKSILFRTNYEYWIWKNLYDNNLLSVCDTNNISLKTKEIQKLKIRFSTSLTRGSDVDFAKKVIKKGGQILYDKKIKKFPCYEK